MVSLRLLVQNALSHIAMDLDVIFKMEHVNYGLTIVNGNIVDKPFFFFSYFFHS
jgi:hypothetical protein